MAARFPGRWVLLLAVAAAACAGPGVRPEPPRLVLADLRLAEVSLLAQRYLLTLEVQNPNPFDLPIQGLSYDLLLNGQPFAGGVSNPGAVVPAYGTERLELAATGTLAGLFRQFSELERQRPQSLSYRLRGHLSLGGSADRVPFDEGGEITLVPRSLGGP